MFLRVKIACYHPPPWLHALCAPVDRALAPHPWTSLRTLGQAYLYWPSVPHTNNFPSMTDRVRAPLVRHTSPFFNLKFLYFFQYFLHLLPLPSGPSVSQTAWRFERIETVVWSVVLTVKLPLTTQGPTPSRTWAWRFPGLTLLSASQDLRKRRAVMEN